MVGEVRQNLGWNAHTPFLIVDAQSVKNADTAEQKGFDGNKLVSGIKRHIGVDTNGLPHMIHVTTANVTDRARALEGFTVYKSNLINVVNVLVDGGYTGEPFALGVQGILVATVEVAKRRELHTFAVIPKRWVVERSFAWLEKCRRLWKNCARKLNTSLQMLSSLCCLKDHEQALKEKSIDIPTVKRTTTPPHEAHPSADDLSGSPGISFGGAGWSSPVARQAHNLKVTGSNPVPATNHFKYLAAL